jgi:hypothetical protein
MSTLILYALFWLILMVVGILNGVLRVSTYGKHMPEIRAHQLSSLTGIIFFSLAVWLMNGIRPIESSGQAFLIGFIWFILTILFEFGFGHFIMKHPWEKLFQDYRIDRGRLWGLVLIWILFVPLLICHYF